MNKIEKLYDITSQLSGAKQADAQPRRDESWLPPWGRGELIAVGDRSIDELLGPDDRYSDEDLDCLGIGVTERGTDALAYYKSVRYRHLGPYPGRWGIFYLVSGLAKVRRDILAEVPGCPKPGQRANEFLRAHEMFHVQVDTWAMASEAALRKPLYTPMHDAFCGRSEQAIEEALANARALGWAKRVRPSLAGFARGFMLAQPGAYAKFAQRQDVMRSELAANVFDTNASPGARRDDQAEFAAYGGVRYLKGQHCPEWWVLGGLVSRWCPLSWAAPPVAVVVESPAVSGLVNGKYSSLKSVWEAAKAKLTAGSALRGLDFKPWHPGGKGVWSIRVDRNFRAHLRRPDQPVAPWIAFEFGTHKDLGHG
ncbi:MAG: hypothetical protein O2855_08960 [Planctomycetota bacterium]|nr:hypothetical protein [Planctomycetota bacterium]